MPSDKKKSKKSRKKEETEMAVVEVPAEEPVVESTKKAPKVQKEMQGVRLDALMAEFFGTFVLCMAIYMSATNVNMAGKLEVALAHVFGILAAGYAVGHVSGGHLNPAVSVALFTYTKQWSHLVLYCIAQLLGAITAGLVTSALVDGNDRIDAIAPFIADGMEDWQAFVGEAVMTFILVATVFCAAVDSHGASGFAAIAIAAALGLGVLSIGTQTNACINPARCFAASLVSGEYGDNSVTLVTHVLAEFVGGILAIPFYVYVSQDNEKFTNTMNLML